MINMYRKIERKDKKEETIHMNLWTFKKKSDYKLHKMFYILKKTYS